MGLGVTQLEGEAVAERMIKVGARPDRQARRRCADHGLRRMARQRAPVERALGVPVIDPSQAGTAQAIAAVRLGYAVPKSP